MLLDNQFYKVLKEESDGQQGTYTVAILPDCNVYDGHFPGNPVCPGVCNIETIKECAIRLTGKELRIKTIKQCRLTAIASPAVCPEVTIAITAIPTNESTYTIQATVKDTQQTYMEYKGTMECQK